MFSCSPAQPELCVPAWVDVGALISSVVLFPTCASCTGGAWRSVEINRSARDFGGNGHRFRSRFPRRAGACLQTKCRRNAAGSGLCRIGERDYGWNGVRQEDDLCCLHIRGAHSEHPSRHCVGQRTSPSRVRDHRSPARFQGVPATPRRHRQLARISRGGRGVDGRFIARDPARSRPSSPHTAHWPRLKVLERTR